MLLPRAAMLTPFLEKAVPWALVRALLEVDRRRDEDPLYGKRPIKHDPPLHSEAYWPFPRA